MRPAARSASEDAISCRASADRPWLGVDVVKLCREAVVDVAAREPQRPELAHERMHDLHALERRADRARDHLGVNRQEAAVVDAAKQVVERRVVGARQARARVSGELDEQTGLVDRLAGRGRGGPARRPRVERPLDALERRVVAQFALDQVLDLARGNREQLSVRDKCRARAQLEHQPPLRGELEGHHLFACKPRASASRARGTQPAVSRP